MNHLEILQGEISCAQNGYISAPALAFGGRLRRTREEAVPMLHHMSGFEAFHRTPLQQTAEFKRITLRDFGV